MSNKSGLDSLRSQISAMKEQRLHASELSEQYSGPTQQVEFKATKDLVGHFGKIYGTKIKIIFPIFAHKKKLLFFSEQCIGAMTASNSKKYSHFKNVIKP